MRRILKLAAAATLAIGATQAGASDQPRIYAVPSHANFCPAGLQPVTMDGTICCGRPNQSMTYQQVMAHPTPRKHKPRRTVYSARANCAVGQKGCAWD